jgi:hypothetical protein
MDRYDEHHLADLLGALPPAPEAWVAAAKALPFERAQLDDIVARAEADQAFRAALMADLEGALVDSGYEPTVPLVEALRGRLSPPER